MGRTDNNLPRHLAPGPEEAPKLASDADWQEFANGMRLRKTEGSGGTTGSEAGNEWAKLAKHEQQTGDGSGVGLFFRLPSQLAEAFPSLGDEDRSPAHVTFLYVGRVDPSQEEAFLATCQRALSTWGRPTRAHHTGLEYFEQPGKGRVAVDLVRFDDDLSDLRWRLRDALLDQGFQVEDNFPTIYRPHTTLAYLKDRDATFDGPVPRDSWVVDEAEVWGLPKQIHKISLGQHTKTASSAHRRSIALMKFLSGVARREGVGQHVYVVGGAVRNFVINQPIKDIDVVIDSVALRGKDSEWFAKEVVKAIPVPTNLTTNQYGVAIITVKGDWELDGENLAGEVIEIANARKESYGGVGGKGYKPSEVEPATIEEDIYRREFTFNTLLWRLYDLAHGPDKAEILDITGCGLRDLQMGEMRCPADPDKTFADDPTRMLRAIKFLMKYGLKIPPDTAASIRRNAPKLKNAPHNAISSLLIGTILKEPALAKKALAEMQRLGLLAVLGDMMHTDKGFRATMQSWASNQKVQLLFDLMDVGLPLGTRIEFLTPEQQKRLREVALGLPEGQPEILVDVLKQPGKVLDTKALISEYGLQGKEIGRLTTLAREAILREPSLAFDGRKLTEEVRQQLSRSGARQAAVFEAPPRMLAAVEAWMLERYSSHVLAFVDEKIQGATKGLEHAKDRLAEMEKARATADADVLSMRPGDTIRHTIYYMLSNRTLETRLVGVQLPDFYKDLYPGSWRYMVGTGTKRLTFKKTMPEIGGAQWHLRSNLDDAIAQVRHGISMLESGKLPGKATDTQLVELHLMRKECLKYTSTAKTYQVGATTTIPVDVTGWKYIQPNSPIIAKINDQIDQDNGVLRVAVQRAERELKLAQDYYKAEKARAENPTEQTMRAELASVEALEDFTYSHESFWTATRIQRMVKDGKPAPSEAMAFVPVQDGRGWVPVDKIQFQDPLGPGDLTRALHHSRWTEITCILDFKGHVSRGGVWMPHKRTLEVSVVNAKPLHRDALLQQYEEIRRIVRHEMQHLGQDLLGAIQQLGEEAGLPSKHLRDPAYTAWGGLKEDIRHQRREHPLRDVEFYTRVADEVTRFLRILRTRKRSTWLDEAKKWLREQPFFKALRMKERGKWQKAVAEFIKGVENEVGSLGTDAMKLAATLTLDKQTVERWRKEFLLLMSNLKRVKSLEDAEAWQKGAFKWADLMGRLLAQVREDLESRVRMQSGKPSWDKKINEEWAQHYINKQEPIWQLLSEVREGPRIRGYRLREMWETRVDQLTRYAPYESQEGANRIVLNEWLEKARLWEQRARAKARPAWKFLLELADWTARGGYYGGGETPVQIVRPERTNQTIAGIKVQLVGFEGTVAQARWLQNLEAGLRFYVQRAKQVLPWMLRSQLPIEAYFVEGAVTGISFNAAATYERDHINFTTWVLADSKPAAVAKVLAHEMGHHLYRHLSDEATTAWGQLIRGNYKDLDLRDVLTQMKPGESSWEFDRRMEHEDPILYLQLQTLLHDPAYKRLDLLDANSIRRYLDEGGNPIFRVPAKPISGYAGKNTEEAFCEAAGLLVAYGPQAVLPEVRSWFKAFVPNVKFAQDGLLSSDEWEQALNREAKTFTLNVGDPILYGKYKNKKGLIKEFKSDEKSGDPIVVIEPTPKGRKQDKDLKLFKIRYDKERAEEMKKEGSLLPDTEWARFARSGLTRLVMFDFDGTLFRGAEFTPEWWADPAPFSWGSSPISMGPPCVPQVPGPEYWNTGVVRALRQANADPSTYTLLITGRVKAHLPRVRELLKQQGVSPNVLYFNPGVSAVSFKKKVLGQILGGLPDVETVEIWENENLSTYKKFVESVGAHLGRNIEVILHPVRDRDLPYQCEAEDLRGAYPVLASADAWDKWAAARYKNKKEVPKADGKGTTTVYEYSEKQVQHRNREKAKRVEGLRTNIDKLRTQYRKDLDAKDEKTRLTALAVALIDETFERVGNPESAKEGHYGVTGWLTKHLTFSAGKATLKYIGKSGVKQTKTVSTPKLVSALREAVKDKSKGETICSGTDCVIGASDVNTYLKPFDVTAKDLRGFHANSEMQNRLKAIRSKGGKLPEDKKEREKKLKDEFKAALEETAEAVGHEASTLKSQYLVPGLEDTYLKDGTVKDKLDKQGRWNDVILSLQWKQGTKTRTEKEDEEVERLVRKEPKKKPPRNDLRRERVREEDAEVEKANATDDRDLSRNYKKIGGVGMYRVAAQYMQTLHFAKDAPHKPGDVWQSEGGRWVGMSPDEQTQAFTGDKDGKQKAEAWAKGKKEEGKEEEKGKKEEGDGEGETEKTQVTTMDVERDLLDLLDKGSQETFEKLLDDHNRWLREQEADKNIDSIHGLFKSIGEMVGDPELAAEADAMMEEEAARRKDRAEKTRPFTIEDAVQMLNKSPEEWGLTRPVKDEELKGWAKDRGIEDTAQITPGELVDILTEEAQKAKEEGGEKEKPASPEEAKSEADQDEEKTQKMIKALPDTMSEKEREHLIERLPAHGIEELDKIRETLAVGEDKKGQALLEKFNKGETFTEEEDAEWAHRFDKVDRKYLKWLKSKEGKAFQKANERLKELQGKLPDLDEAEFEEFIDLQDQVRDGVGQFGKSIGYKFEMERQFTHMPFGVDSVEELEAKAKEFVEGEQAKTKKEDRSKKVKELVERAQTHMKEQSTQENKALLDKLRVFEEGGGWQNPDVVGSAGRLLRDMDPEDRQDLVDGFEARMEKLKDVSKDGFSPDELRDADRAIADPLGAAGLSPTKRGEALADAVYAKTVLANPRWAGGREIKRGYRASEEELEQRAKDAYKQFSLVSAEMRQETANQLGAELQLLPEDAPEREELERVADALALVAAANDETLSIDATVVKRDKDGNPIYDQKLIKKARDKVTKAQNDLSKAQKKLQDAEAQAEKDEMPLDQMEKQILEMGISNAEIALQTAEEELKVAEESPLVEKVKGMLRPEPSDAFKELVKMSTENGTAEGLLRGAGQPGSPENRAGVLEAAERLFMDRQDPEESLERLSEFWRNREDTWGKGWSDMADWIKDIRDLAEGDPSDPETKDAKKKLGTALWAQEVLTRWGALAMSTGEGLMSGPPRASAEERKAAKERLKKSLSTSKDMDKALKLIAECRDKAKSQEELDACEKQGQLSVLQGIYSASEEAFGPHDPGRPLAAQVRTVLETGDLSELDKPYVRQGEVPGQRESQKPPQPDIHRPGEVWETEDKQWSAKNPDGKIQTWPKDEPDAKEKAEAWSKGEGAAPPVKTSYWSKKAGVRRRLTWADANRAG